MIFCIFMFLACILFYVGGWKIMNGWVWQPTLSSVLSGALNKKDIIFGSGEYAGQYAILFNDKYYGLASSTRFFNSPFISSACFFIGGAFSIGAFYYGIFGTKED